MISEARLYARVRGLADPGLPDPVAEHAATGVIRLSASDLETSAKASGSYVSEQQSAQRYDQPPRETQRAAAQTPVPPAKRQSEPVAEAQPMLSETQAIYDRMIRESISAGDMDRAWRLVQEAERAGSRTARRTFLEAVERK